MGTARRKGEAPLLAFLREAQLRLAVARGLQGVARWVLFASILWAALEAAAYGGLLPEFLAEQPQRLRVIAAGLGVGVMTALVRAGWARPGLDAVARHVDAALRLEDRVATAVWVLRSGTHGTGSWLEQALLADVQERLAGAAPRQVAPIRFPRELLYAVVPALVGFALSGLHPGATGRVGPPDALGSTGGMEPVAEQVLRLSAWVGEDARRRADARLEAAAQALHELGEALTGRTGDSGTALQELSRLLAELEEAYGQWEGPAGSGDSAREMVEGLRQVVAQMVPLAEARPARQEEWTLADNAGEKAPEMGVPRVPGSERSADAPAVETAPADRQGDGHANATGAAEEELLYLDDYLDPVIARRIERERRMGALLRQAPSSAGDPAAAPGGGPRPGEGSTPLGEEGAGEDPDPALGGAATEEMLLPLELGEGGRRIQVQAPPPGSAAAHASGRPWGQGAWARDQEQPVDAELVGLERRSVVRGYFLPEGD